MKKLRFAVFPIILTPFFYLPTMEISPDTKEKPHSIIFNDGPYVFAKGDKLYVSYIIEENGLKSVQTDSSQLSQKSKSSLQVNTDEAGKSFNVQLKQNIQQEKAEYPMPEKMLVLSDIEGNFAGMRKLLQANKVIDADLQWTFGKGHVVLCGDFVDRGDQVTEVLWLIYSLEDKAKKAGGYVHYVLGNHEIMNLSGDLRYLNPKYVENAKLMNLSFVTVYGEDSELGKWLRSKNIMEKIGNLCFMHGGISAQMNRMDIDIPRINSMARPFYADTLYIYPDPRVDTIFSDNGPFWYRGLYKGADSSIAGQVDESLKKFNIRHMVTGHTIVSDTVSMWYGGKVFNVDTHHQKGYSEALLIEKDMFYRVNAQGDKKFLIKE